MSKIIRIDADSYISAEIENYELFHSFEGAVAIGCVITVTVNTEFCEA